MTADQIIREEFERWLDDHPKGKSYHYRKDWDEEDGEYRAPFTQDSWVAWQAAWAVAEGHRA